MRKKRGKGFWIFLGIIILIILVIVFNKITKPTYNEPESIPSRVIGSGEVNVTEFADLQCPACAQFHPIIKQVLGEYGDEITYEYKHFPLRQIHPFAQSAGEASECARDQNKFYEFIDDTYMNQNEGAGLRKAELKKRASKLGLDTELFNDCLDSGVKSYQVNNDLEEGIKLNVPGTPTLFVGGKKVSNNYQALKTAIENAK